MSIDVLVVGSLHRDVVVDAPRLPHLDETLPGRGFRLVLGGKGANQAVAAAHTGAQAAIVGRVGRDAFGEELLAGLAAAGVDGTRVAVDPAAGSGMSVAIVTDGGEYGAVIVSGANLCIAAEDAIAAIRELRPRVLVLQNEISADVNRAAAVEAGRGGIPVVWNAAPARDADATLTAGVSILLVNRVEAAAMTGGEVASPDDAVTAVRRLSAGKRDAIVTLGAAGAVHASPQGEVKTIPPIPVTVQSAHGAGDMFAGALAARLAAGDAICAALEFASAAAALLVSADANDRTAINAAAVQRLLTARC